ncbi:MAG TPA: PRC-barrel domain-containing protein [Holophaga sp.]|nr:PRC-barrel domain-containing protein [Holophaga sp.]
MLRSLKALEDYTVQARDGDVGKVADFLMDDEQWGVRHLVVRTGGFMDSREVLISPLAFGRVDWSTHSFHLDLTRERIRNSPGTDTAKPVSRQRELEQFRYYGYPDYWGSSGIWRTPGPPPQFGEDQADGEETPDDVHLRSAKEIRGYHVQGTDARIGHVEDFIVDDQTWAIRYLVVDTMTWWVGRKVLVSPHWASGISWEEHAIRLELTRREIKESPDWDPGAPINRQYEEHLYDYYGRPQYWESGRNRGDRSSHVQIP